MFIKNFVFKSPVLLHHPEGDEGGGDTDTGGDTDVNDVSDREFLNIDDPDAADKDQQDNKDDKGDEGDADGDADVIKIDDQDDNTDQDDQDDDEDKDKDKDKDKDDDDTDDARQASGVRFKDLKKEFPEIFKKFPGLPEIIKTERSFKEIFGTVEEAKEAAGEAEFFRDLESSIMSGDAEKFIESVSKGKPEAFTNFAEDMVERIRTTDDRLYARITTPAITAVLKNAIASGEAAGNQNLVNAAKFVAKYIWGKTEIPEIAARVKPQEDDKLKKEREDFENEKVKDFQQDVVSRCYSSLADEIKGKIDPKDKRITPYLKNNIIRDVRDQINKKLDNDVRHNRTMDSLFERAKKANFNRESRGQFTTAYLQAAKALMPSVAAKVIREAVGEAPPKDKNKENDRQNNNQRPNRGNNDRQDNTRQDRVQRSTKRIPSARDVNWNKTSDRMFLDDKYVPSKSR